MTPALITSVLKGLGLDPDAIKAQIQEAHNIVKHFEKKLDNIEQKLDALIALQSAPKNLLPALNGVNHVQPNTQPLGEENVRPTA